MARRDFGQVRRLPSGKYQARYTVVGGKWRNAPTTFARKAEASAWLARERTRLEAEAAGAPSATRLAAPTFAAYAETWLATRRTRSGPLRPTTRRTYRVYLDRELLPRFGASRLDQITRADVAAWHAEAMPGHPTGLARTYALLRTILATAVDDDLIASNPARVRGATSTPTVRDPVIPTVGQVDAVAAAMPAHLAVGVLLQAWCALRFGELAELRRADVDDTDGHLTLRIRRAVTWNGGTPTIGPPKTRAGARDVAVPPHIAARLRAHLDTHAGDDGGALVLTGASPGRQLTSGGYGWYFSRAAHTVGVDGLRPHDLRHTGLTLAARAGATTAELMARAGHATPGIALRYQHAAADRDRALAARLSADVGG